jgi:hypothetical protein
MVDQATLITALTKAVEGMTAVTDITLGMIDTMNQDGDPQITLGAVRLQVDALRSVLIDVSQTVIRTVQEAA